MYSGAVAAIVLSVSVIIFLIYKRRMLVRLFSLDIANQVDNFEKGIQDTADVAVTKIAGASDNLEQLLAEANETIEELKIRIKIAEEQLYKVSMNEIKQNVVYKPAQESKLKKVHQPSFAQQLIKASYGTALHLDEIEDDSEVMIPVTKKREPKIVEEQVVVQKEQQDYIAAREMLTGEQEEGLQVDIAEAEKKLLSEFSQLDMSGAEPKFKQKQIIHLAANGYDDITIAKALKLGVNEVKLTRKFAQK